MIKKFNEFLNESDEDDLINSQGLLIEYMPHDLALITLRYLCKKKPETLLGREVFFSQSDREAIASEWGKRLPKGFPGPEIGMGTGRMLAPAIHEDPSWRNTPYFDDTDLVFGSYPLVFRCEVSPKDPKTGRTYITSTWGNLGDWLKKKIATRENMLDIWLDSNLSLEEFKNKYRGRISGRRYGL